MNYSCLVNNNNDYYNVNLLNSSNINNITNNLVNYLFTPLTSSPSYSPTPHPSYKPSYKPTQSPTPSPTNYPTPLPSLRPSLAPSERPSLQPTPRPTKKPSVRPSNQPTQTLKPTEKPTPPPTRWGRCINSYAYDVNANEEFSDLYNTSNEGWVNGPYISDVNDTNSIRLELLSVINNNHNNNNNNEGDYGILVGYVRIVRLDTCHIYLNYELFDDDDNYGFLETHAYVGNDTLYTRDNQYGHYPYSNIYNNKQNNAYVYIYDNLCQNTTYYVVAQAIVCGPFPTRISY